jgi:hypothetical protein
MQVFEGKTPAERNKLILMIALCLVALLLVAWSFGFFSGSGTTKRNTNNSNHTRRTQTASNNSTSTANLRDDTLVPPQPIIYTPPGTTDVPGTGRNIFAYYTAPIRPPQTANGTAAPNVPTAEQTPPAPPPPLILAGVSPSNVYARTGEFTLQVSGDKFTPAVRVYFGGGELPTRFVSPQQLSATVPANLISSQGNHEIVVRTGDRQLFSNTMTFNVTPPPAPPFTYVGLIGGPSYNDTAVLKNRSNELLNVQRGDVVGSRFRVTSISERAIEFADTELNIRHTLPAVENRPGNPDNRFNPPPRSAVSDDDEQ